MSTRYSWDLCYSINDVAAKMGVKGRYFGGRKVYISAVHEALGALIDLPTLKELLIIMHQQGDVELSSVDMPRWEDISLHTESEIRHLGAVYHVVVDKTRAM